MKKIIAIFGPTASGKSGLALKVAEQLGGCVVNADAIQTYQDLSLISARPQPEETKGIPHHLYGYLDAWTQGTVQDWLTRVVPVLKQENTPILVGGTGLYLSSLINGINDIPIIDESVRKTVRSMSLEEVKSKVKECPFTDPQRLRRALEVQLSTGKTLRYFQNQPKKKLIEADFQTIFLNPPRVQLYQNCETRFYQMIEQGGVQEVEKLLKKKPTGGVLKAIGVPEIILFLQGDISKEEMCQHAILSTKHYAKRQITWFKHQLKASITLDDKADFTPEILK